uniref:NB-ARC domain-containing protein n=1 Tax=Strongyloides papillosus TaxID=174720 RepID=A0A0N5C2Q1_STREA
MSSSHTSKSRSQTPSRIDNEDELLDDSISPTDSLSSGTRKRQAGGESICSKKLKLSENDVIERSESVLSCSGTVLPHSFLETIQSTILPFEDYITILENNTRTIEAQLLMEQLKHVAPKPISATMIMCTSSFPFWDRFINGTNAEKWRNSFLTSKNPIPKPWVLDYGAVNATRGFEVIYDSLHKCASGGMSISVVGTQSIILPSYNIPKWMHMSILHQGGALSGYVPPSLEVLILRRFTSTAVNFNGLLARSNKLKILVVDSCKLMEKMLPSITTTSSLMSVVCKQRGTCSSLKKLSKLGFDSQIILVPIEQVSNSFWKMDRRMIKENIRMPNGSGRFTRRGHIYYRDMKILPYLCNVTVPQVLLGEAKSRDALMEAKMRAAGG